MADQWMIPVLAVMLLGAAAWKKLPMYDLFAAGARKGLQTAVQVLPNLAAMLCAISLMQSSGLMARLCEGCAPAFGWMGLPAETAPLLFIRPLSGSGTLAMLQELMEQYGPDSRIGMIACTLMGSSETIFYTVCIYTSAVGQKDAGYAIPCALLGTLAAAWLAGLLF